MSKRIIFLILILFLLSLTGCESVLDLRGMGLKGKIVFCDAYCHSFLLNLSTGEIKRIPIKEDMCNPALSPDGTKVAYNNRDGLWIANIDGTEQKLLTKKAAFYSPDDYAQPIAWSPDGRKIAFKADIVYDESPQSGVYIIDADGKNEKLAVVSNRHGQIISFFELPSWPLGKIQSALHEQRVDDSSKTSPDGKRMVFIGHENILSSDERTEVIYVVEIDKFESWYLKARSTKPPGWGRKEGYRKEYIDLHKTRLTTIEEDYEYWGLQWTPDGKKILYFACPMKLPPWYQRLLFITPHYFMMMNPDGTEKTVIKRFKYKGGAF